jgi:hypothetical protein
MAATPTGVNIIYDLLNAPKDVNPQVQMAELGIEYQRAVPETILNLWRFISVERATIPAELPPYLSLVYLNIQQWNEEVDTLKRLSLQKEDLFYQCE